MIRILIAAATAMVVSLFLSRVLVFWLTRFKIGQPIREDGPIGHTTKAGTPTVYSYMNYRYERKFFIAPKRVI